MPFYFEPAFTRQESAVPSRVGLVIPATAELSAALPGDARRIAETHGPPTVAPARFSFHYVPWPIDSSLLADDATVDTGIYTFKVKDAVVGVFELARWPWNEFCWSFASNAQRHILAALRIGQTFDVQFDEPLEQAFHVLQYHLPSGVANSGYGEYAVHIGVDPVRPDGLRIVSAFEPQSKRTGSRLPFFFGLRVFGTAPGGEPVPVWRELLAAAVRQAAYERWDHCLLFTAFSLESFIDRQLADRLRAANMGDIYIDHVLRVGERKAELSALNHPQGRLSRSAVQKLGDRLNADVFTPRNHLAHGRLIERAIGADKAVTALKTTVEFIWDWDDTSRSLLVAPMREDSFRTMIDDALLVACANQTD